VAVYIFLIKNFQIDTCHNHKVTPDSLIFFIKKLKNLKFHKMTCDMYVDGININLTTWTKLNLFKKLEDKIKQKNNKGTKMNQTNKLGYSNSN